jgi:hypothetical protein
MYLIFWCLFFFFKFLFVHLLFTST